MYLVINPLLRLSRDVYVDVTKEVQARSAEAQTDS